MSPGGAEVSPLNIPGWRSFPLRARLAELTGLPTFVDNDAKALALGEGWVGAAAGCANFIAMVVSTGVGGGIVLDRRLLDGRLGNAGHIGHVVVVPDGRACPCGSRGCLEAETSGTALEAMTGQPARLASAEWVERTGMLVGRAIAAVVDLLDLPLAVVSGSVALGFGEPFFQAAQREMDALCRIEFRAGRAWSRADWGTPVRSSVPPASGSAAWASWHEQRWRHAVAGVGTPGSWLGPSCPAPICGGPRRRPAPDGPPGLVASCPFPAAAGRGLLALPPRHRLRRGRRERGADHGGRGGLLALVSEVRPRRG